MITIQYAVANSPHMTIFETWDSKEALEVMAALIKLRISFTVFFDLPKVKV